MLTLMTTNWVGNAPLWCMRGYLAEHGIRLAFRESPGEDRPSMLASGAIQGATLSTLTIAQTFPSIAEHCTVLGFLVQPVGRGPDRLAARRSIVTVEQLHRARVGTQLRSTEWGMLEWLFYEAGLPPKRDYVLMPNRQAYVDALRQGEIDAAILAEPYFSLARGQAPDLHEPAISLEGVLTISFSLFVYRRDTGGLDRWRAVFEAQRQGARRLRESSEEALKAELTEIFPPETSPHEMVEEAKFYTLASQPDGKADVRTSVELVDILTAVDQFYTERTGERKPLPQETIRGIVVPDLAFVPCS